MGGVCELVKRLMPSNLTSTQQQQLSGLNVTSHAAAASLTSERNLLQH
jgi:hypothetical protein